MNVGVELILYSSDISSEMSTLILIKYVLGNSSANALNDGAIRLHGPHHEAWKYRTNNVVGDVLLNSSSNSSISDKVFKGILRMNVDESQKDIRSIKDTFATSSRTFIVRS